MQISSIAFGGLSAAASQFNAAASNIAANSSGAAAPDTVDLSSSAVAMLTAKDSYAANLSTLQVADQMTKQTIDMMA